MPSLIHCALSSIVMVLTPGDMLPSNRQFTSSSVVVHGPAELDGQAKLMELMPDAGTRRHSIHEAGFSIIRAVTLCAKARKPASPSARHDKPIVHRRRTSLGFA